MPPPVNVTWVAFVATTVSVDELPDVIEVGFALIVIVGAGAAVTVTVAVAVALPPTPIAVAIYDAVVVGETCIVPPLAPGRVKVPFGPVMVTCVAFAATTVRVDDDPAVIDEGLAPMLTVGAGRTVTCTDAVAVPPCPVATAV